MHRSAGNYHDHPAADRNTCIILLTRAAEDTHCPSVSVGAGSPASSALSWHCGKMLQMDYARSARPSDSSETAQAFTLRDTRITGLRPFYPG